MIENPIYVSDVAYKIISYSKTVKCDDKLWLDMTRLGYFTDDMIENIVEQHIDLDTQVPDHTPFFRKLKLSEHLRLISKLYFNGRYYGMFVVLCENEMTASYMNAIMLMSDIIAKTVATDSLYFQLESDFYNSVFIDLISGNINSRGLYYNRIMATNLGDLSSFLLLNVEIKQHIRIDDFRKSFQRIFNSAWIFNHNNQFLIVIGSKSQILLTNVFIKSLKSVLSNYALKTCISEEFSDLFHISDYYERNLRAMEISNSLRFTDTLIEYEKFKFIDMVLLASRRTTKLDIKQFVNRKVLKVWEYDNLNNTDYLPTLYFYINCNHSISNTAAKMHVHKNTVTYRITKIRELFDIDPANEKTFFSIYYSCEIMQYYDRIKLMEFESATRKNTVDYAISKLSGLVLDDTDATMI